MKLTTITAGLYLGRQLLGAQHDLVEAVAAHAGVQHAPAGQPLQLRRPGLPVIDLVAVGEGIAHRQDRRARDLLAGRARRPSASMVVPAAA